MSNYLAIATVTETLRNILHNSVQDDVTGAEATAVRPDSSSKALPDTGVNIYLYQVTPNAAWNNADLPARDQRGYVVQRPRVALDLHYLMTFYGDESELEAQRVLGSVARTMHARPMLTQDLIQATLDSAEAEDPEHYLLDSDLIYDVEKVKFTPMPFSLEDLSKLWSVLFQTTYSLSMAYMGTVVLIEAEETPHRALPVLAPNLTVASFRRAVVDRVVSSEGESEPIEVGDTIEIYGSKLNGPINHVRVGTTELQPVSGSITSDHLSVELNDDSLRAGIQGVQIVYVDSSESNSVPLVLHPTITVDQANVTSEEIPVTFNPAVNKEQRVKLYLNEFQAPTDRAPRAYSFKAPADNGITDPEVEHTTSITFAIVDVQAGVYLVRVQVSGAENVLGVGDVDGVDQYNSPTVTIP